MSAADTTSAANTNTTKDINSELDRQFTMRDKIGAGVVITLAVVGGVVAIKSLIGMVKNRNKVAETPATEVQS